MKMVEPSHRFLLLKIISLSFFTFGIYCFWLFSLLESLKFIVFGMSFVSAGLGLFFLKPWSRYLIGSISAFVVGGWLYVLATTSYYGWSGFSKSDMVLSLVIGIAVVLLLIFSSIFVFRFFAQSERSGSVKTD